MKLQWTAVDGLPQGDCDGRRFSETCTCWEADKTKASLELFRENEKRGFSGGLVRSHEEVSRC